MRDNEEKTNLNIFFLGLVVICVMDEHKADPINVCAPHYAHRKIARFKKPRKGDRERKREKERDDLKHQH